MNRLELGKTGMSVPRVAVGCMRMNALTQEEAGAFIAEAVSGGCNFFDHADIYGGGKSEEIFTSGLKNAGISRDKVIIQTKCGIRRGMFDFSKEHILSSVEGSLKRLNTDFIDVLLLHRPDALCEPDEVAEAFLKLKKDGKVLHFGVSNHNPGQIRLLQKYLKTPVAANQLQFSVAHASMVTSGLRVNMSDGDAVVRDGGILDFCRLEDITVQPWSPFMFGFFEGVFLGHEKYEKLNLKIKEIAAGYKVSDTTIALAWILRHPANMQPVIGTMKISRLKDCMKAADIRLSREEWYGIYLAAGNILP